MGRKSLLAFANVALGAALGLLALKFVALYMGRDAYGEVQYAIAILGILHLFTDFNIADAHVKRVSEGWPADDCFVTFATIKLVSTVVFLTAGGLVLFAYGAVLDKPLESVTYPVLFAVMAYYAMKNAMTTAQSTFEAKVETARVQLGNLVETAVRVGLTFLGVWLFAATVTGTGPFAGRVAQDAPLAAFAREHPGAVIALAYAGGAFAGAVTSVGFMLRAIHWRGRFRWDILRSYWSFALPLFLVSAVGVLSSLIDRTALGFFGAAGDAADLGAPRQIVSVLEAASAAAGALLFPTLSALASRGDRAAVHVAVDRSVRYLSLLLLPMVAFLVAFPERVILLTLSDQWRGAGPVLILLAVWIFLGILSRPLVNLLMGVNETRAAARIGIVSGLVNMVLVLLLVPEDIASLGLRLAGLKAVGAGIALLVSAVVSYLLLLRAAREVVGYAPSAPVWKHVVAAALMAALLHAFDAWGPLPLAHWWSFPIYGALGLGAYVGVLVSMGELTRADYDYVRRAIHMGEMVRYIRSEFR
ncbi:MAG TPA: polysaccharide biosynthesis C-terminal domain-containing protein [Candidatus Thermoplasmatota archaeon]|nr:polysaccharide biosynthesis C-terminal domain-containing protein [Candidatus Thermoplasmatota archaeon]